MQTAPPIHQGSVNSNVSFYKGKGGKIFIYLKKLKKYHLFKRKAGSRDAAFAR